MRILFCFLLSLNLYASPSKMNGAFSGRIAKVNTEAGLVRVKVDFNNAKYLNKKDKVEFWDERGPGLKCKGFIVGKSPDYLLLRVPEFGYCRNSVLVTPGAYLLFFSQDLLNNLKMGEELVGILLKKRLALRGRMLRTKRDLDSHIEKVNAANMRYKVLRDKLEAEWRDQLANLEDDRVTTLRNFKNLERRVLDIDHKLEKYRIEDENLYTDRWALDPRLYFKK